ncbi:MAG: tetratricopeptide repeat protein [Phycisphaerales bacterium]|nr:tetratricopeptide repeat protein [Phycisphaerales bacterium]
MSTDRSRFRFAPVLGCALLAGCATPDRVDETAIAAAEQAQRDASVAHGESLVDDGEYQAAVVLFEAVIAEYPETVPAWIGLGDAHAGLREWQEAEPSYAEASRLDPTSYDAQLGHGTSLQVLDRFDEALGAYHRALVIRPDSVQAARGLGTTYLQMGEPVHAVPFTRRAVLLDDTDGRSWVALGAALQGSGDHALALDAYVSAAERMDVSPQLLRNLLNAYVRLDRYREVIGTAQTLESLQGPEPHPLERTGWAWFKLGEFDRSAAAYRRATEADPNWWRAWNGLGVTAMNRWLLSGRTDIDAKQEAADSLRTSLRLNPRQQKVVELVSRYSL